jgi:hypothetical protein
MGSIPDIERGGRNGLPRSTDMPGSMSLSASCLELDAGFAGHALRRRSAVAKQDSGAVAGPACDEPGQEIQLRLTGKRSGRSAPSHTRLEQALRKASESPDKHLQTRSILPLSYGDESAAREAHDDDRTRLYGTRAGSQCASIERMAWEGPGLAPAHGQRIPSPPGSPGCLSPAAAEGRPG